MDEGPLIRLGLCRGGGKEEDWTCSLASGMMSAPVGLCQTVEAEAAL